MATAATNMRYHSADFLANSACGVDLEERSRYFSTVLSTSRRSTAQRRPSDGPSVDLARWGPCGVPSAWRSPTARQPLGEVEGRPHPVHPTPAGGDSGWLAIPEVCPPGEGMALEIDKIFWETKQPS
jgi:hypothetical protein